VIVGVAEGVTGVGVLAGVIWAIFGSVAVGVAETGGCAVAVGDAAGAEDVAVSVASVKLQPASNRTQPRIARIIARIA